MLSPGTAVRVGHTGQTGTVERHVGGGDVIVRLEDGSRVAAPSSQLTDLTPQKSAEQPAIATPEQPPAKPAEQPAGDQPPPA